MQKLIANWVYGGFLAAIVLLCLAPLLVSGWPAFRVITFLLLPAYMFHQFEEHYGDRFRIFFNRVLGNGHEVLSPLAVFITNVPVVWGTLVVAMYAATLWNPGWALLAIYLVLVNALVHILCTLVLRRYNPGLGTALVLFVPLGGTAWWLVQRADLASPLCHAVSLSFAVLVHVAILVHVRRKLHRITAADGVAAGGLAG